MARFETDIIRNTRYKKYKTIRGILFIIFIVYATPAYFMDGSPSKRAASAESKISEELYYYYLGLLIIGVLFGIVHYFSWRIQKLGILLINKNEIWIEMDGGKEVITLSTIDKIKIIRNSTYHKGERIEKPYAGNNWIEIVAGGETIHKHEFSIQSEAHNEAFENIISILYAELKSRLDYKSI